MDPAKAVRWCMSCSIDLDRACAIQQLQTGVLQNQLATWCGATPITISTLKAKFHTMRDFKDRPWSWQRKRTTAQKEFPHQYSCSLPWQSGTDCTKPFQSDREACHDCPSPSGPDCTGAGNVYIWTWRCGGTLCSAMSPDSGYGSWTVKLRRRCGDCYADCCTDSVTAFAT